MRIQETTRIESPLLLRRRYLRALAPVLAVLLVLVPASAPAPAQEFPTQTVKIVVPYPPGGGVDQIARPLAERLAQCWGKPVVVENKGGASTIIGTEAVVKAAPDGHTLLVTSDSTITSNPHLFKSLSYDPLTDLAPVTQLVDLQQMVVAHPSVSANSLAELVVLAKAQPKALNYASYGNGSQPHLLFEMLKKQTGIAIEQVPFKGIAPAITAVVAGETQLTLGGAAVASQHIKAGRMKALAVASRGRLDSNPEVPTLVEAGFPEIDPRSWFGMLAPARTPPAVIAAIHEAVAAAMADREFHSRYVEAFGHHAVAQPPAEFARFIAEDMAAKKRMIATTGITAE